jgi:Family of unknown function (DUF6455)
MWLFIIAVTAAIGFLLAATSLAPQGGNALRRRSNRRSLLADFRAGCRDLSRSARAAFEPRRNGGRAGSEAAIADARWPEPAITGLHHATLLPRRMQALRIDSEALARNEPLLFRHLALRCRQCASPERCARDLDRACADAIDEDWKDYCVNVALLRMLGAIEGIGGTFGAGSAGPISRLGHDPRPSGETRH